MHKCSWKDNIEYIFRFIAFLSLCSLDTVLSKYTTYYCYDVYRAFGWIWNVMPIIMLIAVKSPEERNLP